jgi:hypothetical protein
VVALTPTSVTVAWQERSTAGAATDSMRHQREIDSLKQPGSAVPAAAQWINPVGTWTVVARTAESR